MNLWYMRDNHTFRELPHDTEQAITVLRGEFKQGHTYGMLCADGGKPREPQTIDKNAHARADFAEFELRARIWLSEQLAYKSPGDLEYESWYAPANPSGDGSQRDQVSSMDADRGGERG